MTGLQKTPFTFMDEGCDGKAKIWKDPLPACHFVGTKCDYSALVFEKWWEKDVIAYRFISSTEWTLFRADHDGLRCH